MAAANIIYKILGIKWFLEIFCPAPTFVTADRDEARNPQHFIYVTVVRNFKPLQNNENSSEIQEQNDSKNWKIFTLSIGDESREKFTFLKRETLTILSKVTGKKIEKQYLKCNLSFW